VCVIRSPSSSLSLPRTSRFWSSFCQLGWEADEDAPSDQWPYQPVLPVLESWLVSSSLEESELALENCDMRESWYKFSKVNAP